MRQNDWKLPDDFLRTTWKLPDNSMTVQSLKNWNGTKQLQQDHKMYNNHGLIWLILPAETGGKLKSYKATLKYIANAIPKAK